MSKVGPSNYLSTNINHRIQSYDLLAERVLFELGAPMINIEIDLTALYDFIAQSIEIFTKFTNGTEEYLIFNSNIYEPGLGLDISKAFELTPEATAVTTDCEGVSSQYIYDTDLESQRKVIDVFSFEEGTHTGINTLFTIEQSLAQQMHFAYGMGAKGFDLVSWHAIKDWLEMREKIFALRVHYRFDPRTQRLRLFPEPGYKQYYGLIGCRVERPIRDLVKERWVKDYTLALTKIAVGHARGKFAGTTLFGGGTVNYGELLSQGEADKEKLMDRLINSYEDTDPPLFFVG